MEDGEQNGGRPTKNGYRNSAHAPHAPLSAEASSGACKSHASILVVGERGVGRKGMAHLFVWVVSTISDPNLRKPKYGVLGFQKTTPGSF